MSRPQTADSQNPLLHPTPRTAYFPPSPTASMTSLMMPGNPHSPSAFSPDASYSTLVSPADETGAPLRTNKYGAHPLSKAFSNSNTSADELNPAAAGPAAHSEPEPWSSLALFFPSRAHAAQDTRQHHLDTLKFIAALLLLTSTVLSALAPSITPASALYVFASPALSVALLLTLSARSLLAPLYAASHPASAFTLLSRSILLRPLRFAAPVLITALLQWAIAGSAQNTAAKLDSEAWAAPQWGAIRSWAGLCTLLWGCFTWGVDKPDVIRAFGSNLWFTPWLFQASYLALLLFVLLSPLPTTRYYLLLLLAPFLWATTAHLLPALLGVLLADLSARSLLRPISSLPLPAALPLQLALLALALVLQLLPALRAPLDSGMAAWNVRGVLPASLSFSAVLSAFLLLLAVELSPLTQRALSLRPLRFVSRLAAGTALLPPLLVYTFIPTLNLATFPAWIVTLALTLLLAVPFRLLVEVPTMIAGEWLLARARKWGADGLDAELERAAGERREMDDLREKRGH